MFDIIGFLEDYDIDFATEGENISANYIGLQCCFCGKSQGFHLGVSKDGSRCSCWVCGAHSIFDLIQTQLACGKSEAYKILKEYEGKTTRYKFVEKKQERAVSKIDLPGGPLQKRHRAYLESRNFDPDLLESKYGFKGTGPYTFYKDQDFSTSIIIPVYDSNGRVLSFQARDYTGRGYYNKEKMRYKGLKAEYSIIHYKESLYNLQNAKSDTVVLVEGVFDCLRGGDNFLCSWGTSMQPSQLNILKDYRRVFIIFDSEVAAQEKAHGYGRDLAALGVEVEVIDLESGDRDIGDFSESEIRDLRIDLGLI